MCSTGTCSRSSRELVTAVTADLEEFDSPLAAAKLRDFGDVLTNWYVRRSRERFWAGVDDDGSGREAFDTLFTVLETLTRLAAPLLPLVTEKIWQGLTGGRSVHLTDWPDAAEFPADDGARRRDGRGARDQLEHARPAQAGPVAGCDCRSRTSRW